MEEPHPCESGMRFDLDQIIVMFPSPRSIVFWQLEHRNVILCAAENFFNPPYSTYFNTNQLQIS